MQLAPRIVASPNTCSGRPRIEGTRIRVSDVLGWLAAGMSADEIVADYPPLTTADVKACLDYAAAAMDQHVAAE